jgi:hypothetical protein
VRLGVVAVVARGMRLVVGVVCGGCLWGAAGRCGCGRGVRYVVAAGRGGVFCGFSGLCVGVACGVRLGWVWMRGRVWGVVGRGGCLWGAVARGWVRLPVAAGIIS